MCAGREVRELSAPASQVCGEPKTSLKRGREKEVRRTLTSKNIETKTKHKPMPRHFMLKLGKTKVKKKHYVWKNKGTIYSRGLV